MIKIESNLRYTAGVTPKRVTSGGFHFRGSAPGQHTNVAAVAGRWQHCGRFDRPRNQSRDFTRRWECPWPLGQSAAHDVGFSTSTVGMVTIAAQV